MFYYYSALFIPRVQQVRTARNLAGKYSFGNDFYPIWLTARESLRQRQDLYTPEMTRAIQVGLFGRPLDPRNPTDPVVEYRTFAYPAYTDLLFWPTTAVRFEELRAILAALLAGLTLAAVVLWTKPLEWQHDWKALAAAALLTLSSYQVLEGLYAVQLGLLVGFLIAAASFAVVRNRLLLAGMLMALATIKPQMSLLAIFYLTAWSLHDWHRRRQFVIGLSGGLLVLFGTSLLVWPRWISAWIGVLMTYRRYAEPALVGEVLASPLGRSAVHWSTPIFILALLIVGVGIGWRNRAAQTKSVEFWLTLSLMLAISTVALLPGQAVHDHVILLPGIFLLVRLWRSFLSNWATKFVLITGLIALVWQWPASLLVVLLRPLLRSERFYSGGVLGLPLRTAGIFPFFVLGLLLIASRRSRPAYPSSDQPTVESHS